MDPALWELLKARRGSDSEEVEAIIRLDRPRVEIEGVRIVSRFGPIATCRLRRNSIIHTREEESVRSLKAPRVLGPEPEPKEAGEARLPSVPIASDHRRHPSQPLTGAGVIVAVVDWGCDFAHPNFRRPDGSTRLIALWDQREHPLSSAPRPYGYGTVYGGQQIDRALGSPAPYRALGYHPADADPGGSGAHGTHVMDIAAGNGLGGGPTGIAPEADLIFVHLANKDTGGLANLGDSVRILEAIDFVARTAGRRPWVANLSVGRHGGPHDGCTLAEMAFDAVLEAAPGRFIVQSTGNYYNKDVHASGRLREGQSRTLHLVVDEADVTPNELEVWYSGVDRFAVRMESPHGTVSPWVGLTEQEEIVEGGKVVGRIYNRASDPNNADNHIDIFLYPRAPAGPWSVTMRADTVSDGVFHAWLERDDACSACQTHFDELEADSFYTTGTLANSRIPLVVGAYDVHSPDRGVAPFSSVGPTRDKRAKPDLLAPGVRVLAARSAPRGWPSNPGLLVRKSGTSMAAPHVTGAVALCHQGARHPLWGHEVRKLILSNVEPLDTRRQNAPRYGHGYLDIARITAAVTALPPRLNPSPTARRTGAGKRARRPSEGTPKLDLPGLFDRLERAIQASTSRSASERALLAEIASQTDHQ